LQSREGRSVSELALMFQVGKDTAHGALVAHSIGLLPFSGTGGFDAIIRSVCQRRHAASCRPKTCRIKL